MSSLVQKVLQLIADAAGKVTSTMNCGVASSEDYAKSGNDGATENGYAPKDSQDAITKYASSATTRR